MNWTFPRQVLLGLVLICCAAAYPLSRYGTPEMLTAAIAGAILATVNVMLGYAAIEYSIGKSATTFLKFVLGGMGLRMSAMAGIILLLLKAFGVHPIALVSSLGTCYVVFLILEIAYIQKRMTARHQE